MKSFMTEKSHKIEVHHCVWLSFEVRNVKNVLYVFWLTGNNFRHSSHKENIWKAFQVDYLKGRRIISLQVQYFCRIFYYIVRQYLRAPPQTGHTAEYFRLSLSD